MAGILNSSSWIQWFLSKKNFTHSFSLNLMMAAILNFTILDSDIMHKKNFTHSFSLNMMMADILNSAILNFAILDSATLVFTQTHSHLPRLVPTISTKKKLHSFILTQLDVGRYPEFCHVRFRHCHVGFRHLVIISRIHSKTLSLNSDSDSN